MRRRTYLATLLGFTGGAGAGYYYRPTRDRVSDATSDTRSSVFSSSFDATASDLQLSVTDFEEAGWEGFNQEEDQQNPDAIEDVDVEEGEADTSESMFYNHSEGGLLLSVVRVFETVGDAEDAYGSIRDRNVDRYSLEEDLGFADDEHGYVTGASIIVFRVRNAIAAIAHEPENRRPDLDNALAVAETLRSKWENR